MILNNSDVPSVQSAGNFSASDLWSDASLVQRYNLDFANSLNKESIVFDLYSISVFLVQKNGSITASGTILS